jgi:hypothetical protein
MAVSYFFKCTLLIFLNMSLCFSFVGGADERVIFTSYEGQSVSKMAILDTKTWSWVDVPILGPSPIPFAHGTMTLFQNSKLIVATGNLLLRCLTLL